MSPLLKEMPTSFGLVCSMLYYCKTGKFREQETRKFRIWIKFTKFSAANICLYCITLVYPCNLEHFLVQHSALVSHKDCISEFVTHLFIVVYWSDMKY